MKYIGIKFVDAVPMTAEVANERGYRVSNNTCDGYEVTYDDGYKSWCPKDVFEKHNFVVKNEVLAKTCEGMVSPDYKERFKTEYIQIYNRLHGLKRMLESWDKGTLNFTPLPPQPLQHRWHQVSYGRVPHHAHRLRADMLLHGLRELHAGSHDG